MTSEKNWAANFTVVRDQEGVEGLLPLIEEVLMPLGARSPRAKPFTPEAVGALPELYPRRQDLRELRARIDPRGAFVNDYLRRVGLADA